MSIIGPPLEEALTLPRAHGDCSCACHKHGGVFHVMPCCYPVQKAAGWTRSDGKKSTPTSASIYVADSGGLPLEIGTAPAMERADGRFVFDFQYKALMEAGVWVEAGGRYHVVVWDAEGHSLNPPILEQPEPEPAHFDYKTIRLWNKSPPPVAVRQDTVAGSQWFGNRGWGETSDHHELVPCDRCGHEAAFRDHGQRGHDKFCVSVECSNTSCGLRIPPHYKTRADAAKAWNRTVVIQPPKQGAT